MSGSDPGRGRGRPGYGEPPSGYGVPPPAPRRGDTAQQQSSQSGRVPVSTNILQTLPDFGTD